MSFDRFIRPINQDIFYFTPRKESHTEIPLKSDSQYSRILTRTLLGFDPEATPFPSIFSKQVRRLPSPLEALPLIDLPPEEPRRGLKLGAFQAMLDGPGMSEIVEVPTRPIDAFGKMTFAVGLADTLYSTTFSKDGSQWGSQPLCKIPGTDFLTHVSVVNPNTHTLVASDKKGSVYQIQGDRLVGVAPSQGNPDPIVDMFGRDPSTITFGRQSGHITQVDLRARRSDEFETGCRPSSLALHPKQPLLAVGSERFIAIFDLRFSGSPVAVKTPQTPVTSLAWHRQSQTLFAALGGDEPTLTVNSAQGPFSPLTSLKTHGLVRSILCTHAQSSLAILRDHKQGKCFAMLDWNPSETSRITCTGIRSSASDCLSPSSGAMEIEDNGFLVTFPASERLVHCQIQKPCKERQQLLPPDPFCIR